MDDRIIYAMGGYIEQNRAPHSQCFAYDVETNEWKTIANLTSPRGAIALSCVNGMVHCVGGRDVGRADGLVVLGRAGGLGGVAEA